MIAGYNLAADSEKIKQRIGYMSQRFGLYPDLTVAENIAYGLKLFGEDPLINPAGAMPDGRAFQEANEFKRLLLEDRDKLARAFIEHLCTYALRRVLTVDDQDDLKLIEAEAKRRNISFEQLLEEFGRI